jgi:hypothetical protein
MIVQKYCLLHHRLSNRVVYSSPISETLNFHCLFVPRGFHLEWINDNESTAAGTDRATDPPTVINSSCKTTFGCSLLAIEWTLFTLNNSLLVRLSRLNSVWFRALFTLLPECFSAFPRGTCLLSVFRLVFSFRRYLSPIFRLYYQTILLASQVRFKQTIGYGTITRFDSSFPEAITNVC